MTDPFILKALFSTFIVAVALALLAHSRRSKQAEREKSAHISTPES